MNFTTISGVTIHYQEEGVPDGLPLVFINSLGTDLRIWDEVVPPFLDRFRVIRFDKRGHGLSDSPPAPYTIRDFSADLAGLLDYLDIARAVVIGISVGGMIAMDFAATWPERVIKLVLFDTAAKIGTAGLWQERADILRQYGMAYLGQTIVSRWFAPDFIERNPAVYHGYLNMLTRMPVEGYAGTCEALRDGDLTESVRQIKAPTLVLCGADDMATPPDVVQSLCNLIPQTQYHEISGAAHLPCIEQPEQTAAFIAEFL
jgi:3-oxoadipate enol-lactonase